MEPRWTSGRTCAVLPPPPAHPRGHPPPTAPAAKPPGPPPFPCPLRSQPPPAAAFVFDLASRASALTSGGTCAVPPLHEQSSWSLGGPPGERAPFSRPP